MPPSARPTDDFHVFLRYDFSSFFAAITPTYVTTIIYAIFAAAFGMHF